MGQSKGGGYRKMDTLSPGQGSFLDNIISQAQGNTQAASDIYKQFLPGGSGAEGLQKQAMQNYQQNVIPSIQNQFGSDARSSSALNQALAGSGANLSTDLAGMLAQLQMQAAGGLSGLGQAQSGLGLGTQSFAYQPRQMPFWQQLLLGGIGAGGQIGGAFAGRPQNNINFPQQQG